MFSVAAAVMFPVLVDLMERLVYKRAMWVKNREEFMNINSSKKCQKRAITLV
jgi:hypothetical protein